MLVWKGLFQHPLMLPRPYSSLKADSWLNNWTISAVPWSRARACSCSPCSTLGSVAPIPAPQSPSVGKVMEHELRHQHSLWSLGQDLCASNLLRKCLRGAQKRKQSHGRTLYRDSVCVSYTYKKSNSQRCCPANYHRLTGQPQKTPQKFNVSSFWRLDVWTERVGRATIP